MVMVSRWTPILLLLAMGLVGGCGTARSHVVHGLMEDVSQAAMLHDDVELVSQSLPTYLLLLDGLLQSDPGNAGLMRSAAEGYTAYAMLVEPSDPPRAARLFARARQFGLDALISHRPEAAGALFGPFASFADIDDHLRDSDLPYVFWAASSWGAWIGSHTSSMEALADLPRVIHLMQWVVQRDETYRNAGAHVFLGVCHAALPPILGGKPAQALYHFERAQTVTQNRDLMVPVQMARFYARQIFDRELYVELLEGVLAARDEPVNGMGSDLALQNAIAEQLARQLLEDVDVYF